MVHIETKNVKVLRANQKNAKFYYLNIFQNTKPYTLLINRLLRFCLCVLLKNLMAFIFQVFYVLFSGCCDYGLALGSTFAREVPD